jgi:hypothetical protein
MTARANRGRRFRSYLVKKIPFAAPRIAAIFRDAELTGR